MTFFRFSPFSGPSLLLACFGLASCANYGDRFVVPPALAVPANQVLVTEVQASGFQIYQCAAREDAQPQQFHWVFRAPEADLYDAGGNLAGRHYAGPTWEAADGSKVTGKVLEKSPSPNSDSIPWLLLSATAGSEKGMFAHVSTIQRVDTRGGTEPQESCTSARSGKTVRKPYTATYRFYAPKP